PGVTTSGEPGVDCTTGSGALELGTGMPCFGSLSSPNGVTVGAGTMSRSGGETSWLALSERSPAGWPSPLSSGTARCCGEAATVDAAVNGTIRTRQIAPTPATCIQRFTVPPLLRLTARGSLAHSAQISRGNFGAAP